MEGRYIIDFYTSAGRGIQNMWIDSDNVGQGERFEITNAKEAGMALQRYLESQEKNNTKQQMKGCKNEL